MKKALKLLIAMILLTFTLTGCSMLDGSDYKWDFDYEPKEIKSIQIVEMTEGSSYNYTAIKEIDSSFYETICAEIKAIDWETYYFKLSYPKGTCFLIVFNTGEYDIISYEAPTHVEKKGGQRDFYYSWLCCDEEQFEAIINKYLN